MENEKETSGLLQVLTALSMISLVLFGGYFGIQIAKSGQPILYLATYLSPMIKSTNMESPFYYHKDWSNDSFRALYLRKCLCQIPGKIYDLTDKDSSKAAFIKQTSMNISYRFGAWESEAYPDVIYVEFYWRDERMKDGDFTTSVSAFNEILKRMNFVNSLEWMDNVYQNRSNFLVSYQAYKSFVQNPAMKDSSAYYPSSVNVVYLYASMHRETPVAKWLEEKTK